MALATLAAIALLAPSQQKTIEEVTIRGMRIFARCWRTPTGEEPVMIWTIGSRDEPRPSEQWLIRGEEITFGGLPILPVNGFIKKVRALDPETVAGSTFQQEGGEAAEIANIRGHLDRVDTLDEEIPLPELNLVKAEPGLGPDFGAAYHFEVTKPLSFTTPSGFRIDIPAQGAKTKIRYGAAGGRPFATLVFRPSFKETEDKLPNSPLWKKHGGTVEIGVHLAGVAEEFSYGPSGRDYVVEVQGIEVKPGKVAGAKLVITQSVVLESYALSFRVPVRNSSASP